MMRVLGETLPKENAALRLLLQGFAQLRFGGGATKILHSAPQTRVFWPAAPPRPNEGLVPGPGIQVGFGKVPRTCQNATKEKSPPL